MSRRPITQRQLRFIDRLATERVLDARMAEFHADLHGGFECSTALASRFIDQLLVAPRRAPGGGTLPNVPAGRYAVERHVGVNAFDFWKVERPTSGKWAGHTLVKRVIGGHDKVVRVHAAEARQALEAIAPNPFAAAVLYAQEMGRCQRCHADLTDPLSKESGFGPDCAEALGVDRERLAALYRARRLR